MGPKHNSTAQIVATVGPASEAPDILRAMIKHQMDVVRLNFSWGEFSERERQIKLIRELGAEFHHKLPIIIDLPGPRIQEGAGHTYDQNAVVLLTEQDQKSIRFGVEQGVDYFAVSFVGGPHDIDQCRQILAECKGPQKVIAKIERAVALEHLDEIVAVTDAVMVARGDLGNEVPLERIPFVQADIIHAAKRAGKPVITATQMLLSMADNPYPTRAEVTDVANAILQGSDAVMLSEESARGKYPVETIIMMEKIVNEAEKHLPEGAKFNQLRAL
jgi:pyruvate kinase